MCECELIPPFSVFQSKHYVYTNCSTACIPDGGVGSANKSGWMTGDNFAVFTEYFIKHIKLTKDRPMLFSLDSHESHVAFKVLGISKENGMILLPLSLHTSHKLQPLDKSLYGPFKKTVKIKCYPFIRNNSGKITSYGTSFKRSMLFQMILE
jgi:hypothetical protein